MTDGIGEPTAQAQAIMERLLVLVKDCRVVLSALARPHEPDESSSTEAERILYFTLMSSIDAGLMKTMEDAVAGAASREPTAWADGSRVVGEAGAGARERR